MSYPDSVRYLYALGNELKAGAKFGLERMQALLAGLDHPEQSSAVRSRGGDQWQRVHLRHAGLGA